VFSDDAESILVSRESATMLVSHCDQSVYPTPRVLIEQRLVIFGTCGSAQSLRITESVPLPRDMNRTRGATPGLVHLVELLHELDQTQLMWCKRVAELLDREQQ